MKQVTILLNKSVTELGISFTVMEHLAKRGNSGNDISGTKRLFFVSGTPIPQGSMKVIRGHIIHTRARDLTLWRNNIATCARSNGDSLSIGAVEIFLTFVLKKPKTVTRKEPFVRPDLDKLIRAVLDALTGVSYVDDQQVVEISANKVYADNTSDEGVWISVYELSPG